MKSLILLLLLFLHFSHSSCPNGCSGHGVCLEDTTCKCSTRWFDPPHDTVQDCSELFVDYYRTEWNILRSVCAAMFAIVGLVAVLGGMYSFHTGTDQTIAPLVNIRRIVFGLIASLCFIRVIYMSVDPGGVEGVVPEILDRVIAGTSNYISYAIFISILFHWIDLYHTAVKAIKTENMLQSINANYKGQPITIEEILSRVQTLQKIKIPVIIALVSLAILSIVASCFPGVHALGTAFGVYYSVNYFILVLGFIIYGRKLVSLMPNHIAHKVKRLTYRITFLCLLWLSVYVIALVVLNTTRKEQLTQFFVLEFLTVAWVIGTSSIFMKPNRNFPYLFLNTSEESQSKSHTALSSKTVDGFTTSTDSLFPKVEPGIVESSNSLTVQV